MWVPGQGCAITQTNNTILAATFIYSMCFDLVVLILMAAKLAFPQGQRSQLMNLLFRDGLIYFIIAYVSTAIQRVCCTEQEICSFVANLIATTFMLLNLNAVMSVIFNVPAAIASTVGTSTLML